MSTEFLRFYSRTHYRDDSYIPVLFKRKIRTNYGELFNGCRYIFMSFARSLVSSRLRPSSASDDVTDHTSVAYASFTRAPPPSPRPPRSGCP